MNKQLKLTKKEQEILPKLLTALGSILLSKMDGGVYSPTIEGTIEIEESNREIVFSIYVQNQAPAHE